jgi:hypothetical protein
LEDVDIDVRIILEWIFSERVCLEDVDIDVRIILEWIFSERVGVAV